MKTLHCIISVLFMVTAFVDASDMLLPDVDLRMRPEEEVYILYGTLFDLKKTKGGELSNIMQKKEK